ncbi:MAG TPA: hypothetical protein VEL28_12845 [Candidatus Binatia bacterium]|nr:hypothetical protein [Candidatus Binatia bacterium]
MSTNLRLLIFAAALLAVFFGSDFLLRRSESFWRFAQQHPYSEQTIPLQLEARLATMEPGRLDVAIVGSSVVESNVDPEALTAALKRSDPYIRIFPLPASPPLETAMLASHLLRLRPKIVVYPLTLWSLQDHIDWDVVRYYDPAIALSLFDWREIARDHDEHASALLESMHVVFRHRDPLRRTIGHNLARGWTVKNQAPPSLLFAHVRERAEERGRSGRDDFVCPSIHTRALDLLGRKLTAAGTRFVVVSTPVATGWQKDRKLMRMMDTCLGDRARAGGYRYVPVSELPAIESSDFRDGIHMAESGRVKFTQALSRLLMGPLQAIRNRERHALR